MYHSGNKVVILILGNVEKLLGMTCLWLYKQELAFRLEKANTTGKIIRENNNNWVSGKKKVIVVFNILSCVSEKGKDVKNYN